MASQEKIGQNRLVVGAHYGTAQYIIQRVTAIILVVYTLVLLIGILSMSGFTYEGWRNLFTFQVMLMPVGQVLASLAFISLAWHAYIGIRDIWMDYVKPVGIRLGLYVLSILWLAGAAIYFIVIVWGS
ncbi:MAG: succinate dehydrogenase, hydrophobic membrane anchor protein [Burkholderiaceae bacterium]|nr:succinate dehydrogenase, hydrophobic membrane anchor protein [Burkholderiaceae bacterium]